MIARGSNSFRAVPIWVNIHLATQRYRWPEFIIRTWMAATSVATLAIHDELVPQEPPSGSCDLLHWTSAIEEVFLAGLRALLVDFLGDVVIWSCVENVCFGCTGVRRGRRLWPGWRSGSRIPL